MKRYPHYWWPLYGHRYPSRIAFLEIESESGPSALRSEPDIDELCRWYLLVVDYRDGVRQGTVIARGETLTELWARLAQLVCSKDKIWLFMGPAYRGLQRIGFMKRLEEREIILHGKDWQTPPKCGGIGEDRRDGLCILADPPTMILCKLSDRPGKLLILDVRNLGIEVIGDEQDLRLRCERYGGGLDSCLQALRSNGQGALRGTAGSQAMSALRTRYAVSMLHCHTKDSVAILERGALYGGRCECFRIGTVEGPVYHLDIRNMYPAICRDLPLPVSLRCYHDRQGTATDCVARAPASCIASVRIRGVNPRYPLRRRGVVLYPIGEYNTVLSGPELQRAIDTGCVLSVSSCAEYTTSPVLREFMTDWLGELAKARATGNVMLQQWIKRVMVSLVGKFAETGKRWIAAPSRTERGPYAEWGEQDACGNWTRYRNFGWNTMREEISGESYWSIPAITAFITSAGRMQLNAYIEQAGREHVFYCDTDSIFCDEVGYNRLRRAGNVRDGEAGYPRLLGSYNSCDFKGIRHYIADGNITCSGPPKGEIQAGESRADYAARMRAESMGSGFGEGTGGRRVRYSHNPEVYQHGTVLADGRVTPFEVKNG